VRMHDPDGQVPDSGNFRRRERRPGVAGAHDDVVEQL
jgi:hypothetical protein